MRLCAVMPATLDPLWPTAASLLSTLVRTDRTNVALLGVPTYATSLTERPLCETPHVVRQALTKYSTWSWDPLSDLSDVVNVVDYGDVHDPDSPEGQRRVLEAVRRIDPRCEFTAILGGDNALTFTVLRDLAGAHLDKWGLVTLDAHLDLRDGASNGSPVRQLLEAGLPGSHVVQVGLADFANSAPYARRALDAGITVVPRSQLCDEGLVHSLDRALSIAGAEGRRVYVDVDLDVADRGAVPGCPAAVPGGLSAAELRRAVRYLARNHQVHAMDFTEVDASRDSADQRTIRLMALLLLEAISGVSQREGGAS